jgi:mono/diheme cytochrome c family protein
MDDPDTDVALQAILTAKYLQLPSFEDKIRALVKDREEKGIRLVGDQILNPEQEPGFGDVAGLEFTPPERQRLEEGSVIFNELCVQCHGADGTGTSLGNGSVMAPSLRGSPRVQSHPEYVTRVILHGLEGPLDGKSYPAGIMVGNSEQSDEWVAAIASYIRIGLTNEASMVGPSEVARIRQKTEGQSKP